MLIRAINTSDIPALRQIYLASRSAAFTWADPASLQLDDFDHDTRDERILVTEINGQLIGFISIYMPDDFIHLLFVDPTAAGHGAGQALLKAALKITGRPVRLKCVSANAHALTFYARNGWVRTTEIMDAVPYWNLEYR